VDVDIDHASSACAAGTLRGVHYDTRLSTRDAELLLMLRTGAILKTPCVEYTVEWAGIPAGVEQEGCADIVSGKKCQIDLGSKGMSVKCSQPLSIRHFLSHVTEADLLGATMAINKESQVGNMKEWRLIDRDWKEHPKWLALGFVPNELYKNVPPHLEKTLKKQLAFTAATYAKVGLRYYRQCAGDEKTLLPEFVVAKGEDMAKAHLYVAKADAAFREEKGGVMVGLGGFLALSSNETLPLKIFRVRRWLPQLNTGVGEHLGSLVLAKVVKSTGIDDVCLGSDNTSVPNQHEGEWVVNNPMVRLIRAKTAEVKAHLSNYHDVWFPREENAFADKISKEALEMPEIAEPGWVDELDEVITAMEDLWRSWMEEV